MQEKSPANKQNKKKKLILKCPYCANHLSCSV